MLLTLLFLILLGISFCAPTYRRAIGGTGYGYVVHNSNFSNSTGVLTLNTIGANVVSNFISSDLINLASSFTLAFDYVMKPANTTCTSCPNPGFAFLLMNSNSNRNLNHAPNVSQTGFGVFGGQTGSNILGLTFDHYTTCTSQNRSNFNNLIFAANGVSSNFVTSSIVKDPLDLERILGCSRSHHVVIDIQIGTLPTAVMTVTIDSKVVFTATYDQSQISLSNGFWGLSTMSSNVAITISNIEWATESNPNNGCFVGGCGEGDINLGFAQRCVISTTNPANRNCECASGYSTYRYKQSTFTNIAPATSFPKCIQTSTISQCGHYRCDAYSTCSETAGTWLRNCTCFPGYTATATTVNIQPGAWSGSCVRSNPCDWTRLTSANTIISDNSGDNIFWNNTSNTLTMLPTSDFKSAWYNQPISSNRGFSITFNIKFSPTGCSGNNLLNCSNVSQKFVVGGQSISNNFVGEGNGFFQTGNTSNNGIGWEFDMSRLCNEIGLLRDVSTNGSYIGRQSGVCFGGMCKIESHDCSVDGLGSPIQVVITYYPANQIGTNSSSGLPSTNTKGVFGISLSFPGSYDYVKSYQTTQAWSDFFAAPSKQFYLGFTQDSQTNMRMDISDISVISSATCPASCLVSTCGDESYNKGLVSCLAGSSLPEDTRTCRCIAGYDMGDYEPFASQSISVLPPYCSPRPSLCTIYGGCGVHATCQDLPTGGNGRVCTCESGYETNSGKTSDTLYGNLNEGQGLFGGGANQAVAGCTQVSDLCRRYGCGDNAMCLNSGVNMRTCTCISGYLNVNNESSNILLGNTTFLNCSKLVNTCLSNRDTNATCNFTAYLTRVVSCITGYSIGGYPTNDTTRTVFGDENSVTCLPIDYCQLASPCGVNAGCTPSFRNRTCVCNNGYTTLSNNSLLGGSVVISDAAIAPGCNYTVNYCLNAPDGAGSGGNGCVASGVSCIPAFYSRICTCKFGLAIGDFYNNSVVLIGNNQFPVAGCNIVDMCAQFGCNDTQGQQYSSCSFNAGDPGKRKCTCGNPPNMEIKNNGTSYYSLDLVGNTSWTYCATKNYCTDPAFNYTGQCGVNSVCSMPSIGVRQCTCNLGYTRFANGSLLGTSFQVLNDAYTDGCMYLVDGCLPQPDGYGGCGSNSNCVNTLNTRSCTCLNGYSRNTSEYYDINETLIGNQSYTGCGLIDMCANYGCNAGEANASAVVCSFNSSQPGIRSCICPPGFLGNRTIAGPLPHAVGCQIINLCSENGCGLGDLRDPNAICIFTAFPFRTCQCVDGWQGTEILQYDANHTNCTVTDMCLEVGCGDYKQSCSFDPTIPNQRTCYCATGTLEGQSVNVTLIGTNQSNLICTDIDECELYGCVDPRRTSFNISCTQYDVTAGPAINQRICTCPSGFTGTATIKGSREFGGCFPNYLSTGVKSLGFTLSNGFWNDWKYYVKVDINRDGLLDFFFQRADGTLGYVLYFEPLDWTYHAALDSVDNVGVHCANPKVYRFSEGSDDNHILCMRKDGTIVLYIYNPKTQYFDRRVVLTLGINVFTASQLPSSDYVESDDGTGYMMFNDGNQTLVLGRPSTWSPDTQIANIPISVINNNFSQPPGTSNGVIVSPVWFDLNKDGTFDLIFGWEESEPRVPSKFIWYLQNPSIPGNFTYVAQLPTMNEPAFLHVENLSKKTNAPSLIALTSECFSQYLVQDMLNYTDNDAIPYEDGSCPGCGCGTSGGIFAADLNVDGNTDMVIVQNGGAAIYFGSYTKSGYYTFQPITLLGGASSIVPYDHFIPESGHSQLIVIATGITVVYDFYSQDECKLGTDDCRGEQICTYTNEGMGYRGYNCSCASGYNITKGPDFEIDPLNFTCTDIDECQTNEGGCGEHTICVNTPGSRICECENSSFILLQDQVTCALLVSCFWNSYSDWSACRCGVEKRRQRTVNIEKSADYNSCNLSDSTQTQMCPISQFCFPVVIPDDYSRNIDQAREKLNVAFSNDFLRNEYSNFAPWFLRNDNQLSGTKKRNNNENENDFFGVGYFKSLFKKRNVEENLEGFEETQDVYENAAPEELQNSSSAVFVQSDFCNLESLKNVAADLHELATNITGIPYSSINHLVYYTNTSYDPSNPKLDADNCTAVIDLSGAFPASIVGVAVAVPLAVIFTIILLVVLFLFIRKWRLRKALSLVDNLPREVTTHYRECIKNPEEWEQIEVDPPTWRKELTKPSDKAFVLNLFAQLDGDMIGVKQIYAVYNRSLVTQLSLTKQKFDNRADRDSQLFFAEKWKQQEESENKNRLRQWTKDNFLNRLSDFMWNQNERVGILPVIHGTSIGIAWKVCVGGFANLSVLDVGFFGSGIYFTTSAKYSIPYFATKPNPAIIISYLIPGNPYPVVEQPSGPDSIAGNTLKPGYQSHYVSTTSRGAPHTKPTKHHVFDEIVINQEAQVAPAYVLVLDVSTFTSLIKQFERKTLEADATFSLRARNEDEDI